MWPQFLSQNRVSYLKTKFFIDIEIMDYSYRYFVSQAAKTHFGSSPIGVTLAVVQYAYETFKYNPAIVGYVKNIPFTIQNQTDFQKFDDEIERLKTNAPKQAELNVPKEGNQKVKAVRTKAWKKIT